MRATSPKGKTKTKSKRSKEVSRPERNRSDVHSLTKSFTRRPSCDAKLEHFPRPRTVDYDLLKQSSTSFHGVLIALIAPLIIMRYRVNDLFRRVR